MPKSKELELTYYMRKIVLSMMKRYGRDFTKCQLCPTIIPAGKHQIHHTKYEGATYRDLLIVCRSCNNSAINKFLN